MVDFDRLTTLVAALREVREPAAAAQLAAEAAKALDSYTEQRRAEDEFLSLMSHELRTPLTSIRGYAQLTLRQARAPQYEPLRPNLQTIMDQSDRLTALTDVLLDVARIRTGRMALHRVTVDLSQVAQASADAVRARTERVFIDLDLPDGGLLVEADRTRLGEVVEAYLDYAAEQAPAGTPVRLHVGACDSMARVTVEHRGDVLEPAARERLFDQLVVLAEDGHARALGHVKLHIAAGAVRAHGGRTEVHSPVPGATSGARLTAWVPRSADKSVEG